MGKDQDHADFIDDITRFAMRQASRRGFIKWLGKGGLALAAGTTAGLEFLRGTAFAAIPCSYYLPGCTGPCTCATSYCHDPDSAESQTCTGFCGTCVSMRYMAYISWYWNGSKCVASKSCVSC